MTNLKKLASFFKLRYPWRSSFNSMGHENKVNDHQTWNVLRFNQILSTSNIRNIWRTVRRICMWILGLKGLIRNFIFRASLKFPFTQSHPIIKFFLFCYPSNSDKNLHFKRHNCQKRTCFQSNLLTTLSLSSHNPGFDRNSCVCPCSLAPWLCSGPPWWWWWCDCSVDPLTLPAENT